MGYEILSDDIVHTKDSGSKDRKPRKFRNLARSVKPFHIHISIIILIALGIFFFLISDYDFDLNFNLGFADNETGVLTLSGNFVNFTHQHDGNLSIYSSKFTIESQAGTFDGESQTINLENFSGIITQENNTIVFRGKTQAITYGKNSINTLDKNFTIISKGKTQTKLLLKEITFPKLDGTAKLDSTLNYDFENSSVLIENFDSEFAYDGSFTFTGKADKFEIVSNENNLKINFDRNLSELSKE